MDRAEIIKALEASNGDPLAAAQMIMASKQIQPRSVTFGLVAEKAKKLFKEEPNTLFVFDLDDTTFTARGRKEEFELPDDDPHIKKFKGRNSYYTTEMAEFLRDIPNNRLFFLTAGGYEPQLIEEMVDSASDKPRRKKFESMWGIRFEKKLQVISDFLKEMIKAGRTIKRVVFFDDKRSVFVDKKTNEPRDIDWPDNVEVLLYRVHLIR